MLEEVITIIFLEVDNNVHTWAGSWTQRGGGGTPGGRRPGRGGGREFFYPGGSLLVKIGQNFFTWGVI